MPLSWRLVSLRSVFLLVSFSSFFLYNVDCAKILMVSPQFQSNVLTQRTVGEALVQRGHRVFIALASRYPRNDLGSFGDIEVLMFQYPKNELYAVSEQMEQALCDVVFDGRSDPMAETRLFTELIHRECDLMMNDQVFMERVRSEKFDLIIVDPFILAPCTLALPAVLGVRFVTLTGFYFPWSIGQPALPSFFAIPGPRPMPDLANAFINRLGNTIGGYLAFRYLFFPMLDNTTLLHRHVPGVAAWDDLLVKSELFLIENDHWLDNPEPLFPNAIAVSGLTARPPMPLPPAFKEIYDNTADEDGVILVSFGSTAYRLPHRYVMRFLNAFSQLNQTVIARFDVPHSLANEVPANVKLVKWLPQNDVLGHSKTRLFVTHCGSRGQYEALYHGVPMLGLPIFAEQIWNCDRVRRKNFGLAIPGFFDDGGNDHINVSLAVSTRLRESMLELLKNRTYRDSVVRQSAIWRHAEPQIATEKAGFWIDHVIKFGGEHLRPSSLGMPLYQFLMLDILAVFLCALLVVAIALFCCVRAVARRVNCARSKILESKKQD